MYYGLVYFSWIYGFNKSNGREGKESEDCIGGGVEKVKEMDGDDVLWLGVD